MPGLKGKKILLIDDAPDARVFARRILAGDGADVEEASTIDEGLAIVARSAPHLIITDLMLPEKTGFDLLAERANNPTLAAIPTLVLSSSNDPKSVVRAISSGAVDYVLKPLKANLLLQKARKHLR